ncbi:hypothetical protein KJZ00_06615 [Cutibacterium avidum]|uniref:hypothetical protein n=1 Tax=Cutibacterium avidum TaxID=33010 RepID=UPI0008F58C53|nr:hypothetical protein [Cutibacterium avidum]MCO6660428.1 hypothetical protein [Cutibacterium avidum]MDK7697933.1 hypothetical protein [Cutibacterium avidum]OIJ79684.1 hypothetical protein APY06_10020 [Cutibacterium avidum]
MLFAVTKFKRVMALLGVIYLTTVGCLYLVLAERSDDFIRNSQVIQGTVTAVYLHDPVNTGATRYLMHTEGGNVAAIKYTYHGVTDTVPSNPYRNVRKYQVGQQVDLVVRSTSGNPEDAIVAVRDRTILGLRLVPWGFLACAVLMAAWFWRDSLRSQRRRRARSHRQTTPAAVEG